MKKVTFTLGKAEVAAVLAALDVMRLLAPRGRSDIADIALKAGESARLTIEEQLFAQLQQQQEKKSDEPLPH